MRALGFLAEGINVINTQQPRALQPATVRREDPFLLCAISWQSVQPIAPNELHAQLIE